MIFILPRVDLLVPFLLTVAAIELTPGPNMGYLAIVGSRWGRAAGLVSVAGVTLGLAFYLVAAAAGLAQIAVQTAWLYDVLRWLGAGYLVWLAFDSWRGQSDIAVTKGAEGPGSGRLFARGFVANVLNPKAALFYAVLLPGFTDAGRGPLAAQVLALGAIHLAVATTVHLTIVLTASGLRSSMASWGKKSDRLLARATAAGLLAVAVWMSWEAALP